MSDARNAALAGAVVNPLVLAGVAVALDLVDEFLRRRHARAMTAAERDEASRRVQAEIEARCKVTHERFDRVVGRS